MAGLALAGLLAMHVIDAGHARATAPAPSPHLPPPATPVESAATLVSATAMASAATLGPTAAGASTEPLVEGHAGAVDHHSPPVRDAGATRRPVRSPTRAAGTTSEPTPDRASAGHGHGHGAAGASGGHRADVGPGCTALPVTVAVADVSTGVVRTPATVDACSAPPASPGVAPRTAWRPSAAPSYARCVLVC